MNRNDLPFSPAAERNREPISAQLRKLLRAGDTVLEIGSGTGQHAVAFHQLLPGLRWQTTERPGAIAQLEARIALEGQGRLPAPQPLVVGHDPWPSGPFDAVFTANTFHIMSWDAVCAVFEAVPAVLKAAGPLLVYGPFKQAGEHTAPSNAAFDEQLRASNPEQGIRDLAALERAAARHHLSLEAAIAMPANNQLLCFRHAARNRTV